MATEQDRLDSIEKRAKILVKAAKVFDELIEHEEAMEQRGTLPDDEATETMRGDMETARDACQGVSLSMTMVLAQHGRIPDFADESETEDDDVSPTFY